MRRALPLVLVLALGCVAPARLARPPVQLARAEEVSSPLRLGGPEASEPVASLGTWVPAQAMRRTLLGQAQPPPAANYLSAHLAGTETFTGAKTFSATITSTAISGTNGFACAVAGCRYQTTPNANGFIYGDTNFSLRTEGNILVGSVATGSVSISSNGSLSINYNDGSGTPGNVTLNGPSGKAAVANGATSIVVSTSSIQANDRVVVTPWSSSATNCAGWYVSNVTASTSFTLTCPSAATANWSFQWVLIH